MKLLTLRTQRGLELGIKTDRGVLNLRRALSRFPAQSNVPLSIEQVLAGGDEALRDLREYVARVQAGTSDLFVPEAGLELGPCVPNPGKIICVGLNYRKHAEEAEMEIPAYPILFSKFANAVSAAGEETGLPAASSQVDYEAELVIVIGKNAKKVNKESALDYVFGYCNGNDLSARDLQFRSSQWLLGKTCDGFCPLGPYLVTSDEVGDPGNLAIRSFVNGEVRQDSNTSYMIFDCAELVSYVSQHMSLEPGDIIMSGTPEGVILGYPEEKRVWLKDGDEVTVEIEKLGRLSNRMKQL